MPTGGARRRGSVVLRIRAWLLHGAVILLLAFGAQQLVLQRGNTLHANGRWIATKVDLEYGILGSVSFLVTRTALHRGRLDLGVWHGDHELLYGDPVRLQRLALRARLRGGDLMVYLVHDGERFAGVLLRQRGDAASACVEGLAGGRFTERRALAGPPLSAGWHTLEAVAEDGGFRILLDGRAAGSCQGPTGSLARFGLRGTAAYELVVDDLVAESADPARRIREDFENHRRARTVLAVALASLGLLYAAVAAAALARGDGPLRLPLAATHLTLGACLGLALAADTFYLSRLHPEAIDFARYPYENRIEYESAVTRRLAREVPPGPAPAGVRRVLLVGSSQTWGSGASDRAHTWAARLEAGLQAGAGPGERFEVVNTGIPGLLAPRLAELFESSWLAWEPELVIVDLANNDRDVGAFERALARIAQLGAERGVRTVFVPEANDVRARAGSGLDRLEERHAAMRRVAARYGVAVVEAHAPLAAETERGFLWWDRVHLTDFGQELLADVLLAQREVLLRAPPPHAEAPER